MNTANSNQFEVRLAVTKTEVLAAQKLRYQVFVKEFGAKVSKKNKIDAIEADKFDYFCDHLILIDKWAKDYSSQPNIVGTIRLMRSQIAESALGFYTATEYNLDTLTEGTEKSVEIGRACVDKNYRRSIAIHFLWLGLAEYIISRDITLMFGVASFHGTAVSQFGSALTLLKEKYSAPKNLNFRAKKVGYVDMSIIPLDFLDYKKAMDQMPSLLKAYLRMGAQVSDGAFIDTKFNTIDVGLMIITDMINKKYRDLYGRSKTKKESVA